MLRVALKKTGLDPRRDVQIVEITFPNIAPAIREKRIDCGVLVIPFLPVESAKGDLRAAVHRRRRVRAVVGDLPGRDQQVPPRAARRACARSSPITSQGLAWYYDPANREKAIELVVGLHQVAARRCWIPISPPPRDYYRDPERLRVGCGDPEADRRDGRVEADRPPDRRRRNTQAAVSAEAVRVVMT